MFEHKKTMYQRLLFLEEHSYLSNIKDIAEQFKELSETFLILRNLLLKYEKTGEDRLVSSMLSILHEKRGEEKLAVQALIDCLDRST
ncbi:hypothetical protein D3C84_942450 [compost metagenome]